MIKFCIFVEIVHASLGVNAVRVYPKKNDVLCWFAEEKGAWKIVEIMELNGPRKPERSLSRILDKVDVANSTSAFATAICYRLIYGFFLTQQKRMEHEESD